MNQTREGEADTVVVLGYAAASCEECVRLMLRYIALDRSESSGDQPLSGAYVLGPDSVPIAGEVICEQGIIRCEKSTTEAAALALQVTLDQEQLDQFDDGQELIDGITLCPLGELTLQTCLLPERDRPYLLVLELARHRMMMFLNRLEEWQAFDIPESTPVMRLFGLARSAFTDALVSASDSIEPDSNAARLGMRALWIAIEASERLTLLIAQRDFQQRMSGEMYISIADDGPKINKKAKPVLHPSRGGVVLPQKPAIGCSVSPAVFDYRTKQALEKSCDFITMPMRWIEMEPREGEYEYAPTDRWIEWAIRTAKIPVVAGPLIDFRPTSVPDWLYIWENDYETLRELVYEHIKALVTRYRRTVTRWTVCSGLHTGEHFKLSFEQMMDLTRICVLLVRKLHPRATMQIEITQPWGEYHTTDRQSLPPTLYAEMLSQAGVQIDAFALRLQMGSCGQGQSTRDLMSFSALLDHYATLDRPLSISAIGAPAQPMTDQNPDCPKAGHWRQPWSDAAQAQWMSAISAIALSKPYVQSFCWHDLAETKWAPTEMTAGGLLGAKYHPRPSFDRLVEARNAVTAGVFPARVASLDVLGIQSGQSSVVQG